MIFNIIHYCWLGGAPLPPLAEQCLASWHLHMPDWQYMCWNESNFDIAAAPLYVRQAYEARKFAFVSDYVRLWALEQYGGLYMDVDFMVYRPFDNLMDRYPAFAGYEGSKRQPVMQGVLASEPHGAWVRDMLSTYEGREFVKPDGSLDLTPNTSYFTDRLESQGFIADGKEKDVYILEENNIKKHDKNQENIPANQKSGDSACCEQHTSNGCSESAIVSELPSQNKSIHSDSGKCIESSPYKKDGLPASPKNTKNNSAEGKVFMLHVFPVYYFCPVLTTGEDVRTPETYCEHKGESSWAVNNGWKAKLLRLVSPAMKTKLIKLKRKLLG